MADARPVTLHLPLPAAIARGILLVFALFLPVVFDLTVPEVAGDIRWSWTHLAAILLTGVGIAAWAGSGKPLKVNLKQPVIFAWALLLAIWAAVSIIDAINPDRAIVLIKAMYAQLILMVAVYTVWKPGFTRKLVWMMVLPLGFTSFVGICQFFAWTDPIFKTLLTNTFGLGWLGDLWPSDGPINAVVNFYLQSAVPGSTFANKNLAGSYTVMILPLAGYLVLSSRSLWGKGLAGLLLTLGSVFLLYSRSRASWLACVVGLLMLAAALILSPAWRRMAWQRTSHKQLAWLLGTVLLAVSLFGFVKSPVHGAHGLNRSVAQQVEALTQSGWDEIGGRVAYNLNSLVITKDYWFNGVGLGNFFGIYPAYHDAIVETPTNSYNIMARPQRTHTDLMQAFTEMGIPGGIAYASVLLTALLMAWRMGRDEVVEKVGLFPLFGGLSLFVVSVNALMDFPMQLPTAPALASMLMGLLTASYLKAYPKALVGWKATLSLPRLLWLPTLVLWGAISGWALWDDYQFRAANQVLKAAMVRIYSGVNDDETLRLATTAQDMYPWDPRIQEHLGVVYANYKGSVPMTLEDRISKMEWALSLDPWGPNHLVNLSGQYLQLAENAMGQGNAPAAQKALDRVEDLFGRLQRVGGFSHFTWGVGSMLRLLQGRNAEAIEYAQKALAIQPDYPPALNALAIASQRLGVSLTAPQPTPPTQ